MGRMKASVIKEPILEVINNGWRLVETVGRSTLRIECVVCKKKRVTKPRQYYNHKRNVCMCSYVGQKNGRLKVEAAQINRMLKCSCECGNMVWIPAHDWDHRKSCGCLREEFMRRNKRFINLIGKKFGKLKVVSLNRVVDYVGTRQYFWNCRCKCGRDHVVTGSNLKSGRIANCPASECRKTGDLT